MAIDLVALKKEFEEHINSMSKEELMESAKKAAEMTAGCDDDWYDDDVVEVIRCRNCMHRVSIDCPMFTVYSDPPWDDIIEDRTEDNGFCYKGKQIPSNE